MSTELATMDSDQLVARMEYAKALAVATLLPDHYKGKPANVLLVLEYGRSLGIEPITALNAIAVVKGKPTMSAELMRALVARAGHRFRIVDSSSERCIVEVARREWPDDVSRFTYTIVDAKTAGLDSSDTYKRHPKAMLLARVTTQACRAVFADVIAGISYTPDELDELPAPAHVERVEEPVEQLVDDDGVIVEAELVEETAPANVRGLRGPAAKAYATDEATARQLHELGAFSSSIGYATLEAFLDSPDAKAILGGAASRPLSKAHASQLITAARDFDRVIDTEPEPDEQELGEAYEEAKR